MGGVVNILVRQVKGDDLAVAGVNANVQLAPSAVKSRLASIAATVPFTSRNSGGRTAMAGLGKFRRIEAVGEESGLPPIAVELARRSNNGLAQQETSGRHFRRHAPAV